MFEIRKATNSDASAIRRLIREVGINPLGLDWRRFLLAVDQHGKMVGCAQIKPHRDGSLELASVAVVSHYRHQGVAGALIHHLLRGQHGPVYLTCRAELSVFYNRFGFEEVKDSPDMPVYFRRIQRIFQFLVKIGLRGRRLAVMKCERCVFLQN
jgi:N-acetylglutamate synthase-like GNAT family acetyltransferase